MTFYEEFRKWNQTFDEEFRKWNQWHPTVATVDQRQMTEEMKLWLEVNCGPRSLYPDDTDGAWSYWSNGTYLFKDERLATLFLLRWA